MNRCHCQFPREGRRLRKGRGSLRTSQAWKQVQDEAANVSPNTAQQCVPAGVTSPRPADGRVSQCPSSGQDRGSRQDSGASACEPCGHGLRRFPGLESQTHSRNAPAAAPREMWGQPTGFRLGPHLLPKPFTSRGTRGWTGRDSVYVSENPRGCSCRESNWLR